MSNSPDIFIIEDSRPSAELYEDYLKTNGLSSSIYYDGTSALNEIESKLPRAILLDLGLPDMDGFEILKFINSKQLPIAVIVVTSNGSVDVAVEAMRLGAADFIEKPFNKSRLIVTLLNVLKQQKLLSVVQQYEQEFDRNSYCGFIGSSLPMQVVYRIIDSAASSKATVFISGESGTGKELCAEAIHTKSPRSENAFIPINCAAIPKELFESEIFGHIKGAFSGATSDRKGAAEMADGGTLFLDEICEMDFELQSKLLRFIQTGTFSRIGETKLRSVNIRFVCATNRDPLAEVAAGKFREDLFYRLNVIPVSLPPLSQRDSDITEIAQRFLENDSKEEGKNFTSFSPNVVQLLLQYNWPGNVRELRNVIKNIVVLNHAEIVTSEMLPASLSQNKHVELPVIQTALDDNQVDQPEGNIIGIRHLWVVEKETIESAINLCNGNVPLAAAFLGISASTIYRKLKTWEEVA